MCRRPRRALWPLLTALALAPTLAPRFASADAPLSAADRRRARALYDEAEALIDAERWGDALAKLEALAALNKATETPVVIFYVGLCKANLGRLRESLQDYRRARALLAADARSPSKERKLLEEKLSVGVGDLEARIPRVTLRWRASDPARETLRISIDSKEVETARVLDAPFELDPGLHELAVEAPARAPVDRTFTLSERQALELPLDFAPLAPPPAPRPPPPRPPPPSGNTQRSLGYAALGLGAAAAVVAGVHVTLDRLVGNAEKNLDLVSLSAAGGGLVAASAGLVLLTTAPPTKPPSAAFAPASRAAPAAPTPTVPTLRFGGGPAFGAGASLWVGGSF